MKRDTTHRLRQAAAVAALIGAAPGAFAQDALIVPIGEGIYNWESYEAFAAENDFRGERLTVTGASTGPDADRLRNLFAYFTEATGAEVALSGSESFEQDIVISAQAGSAPNIAMFPQPGLARDLAARGALVPLGDEMRQTMLDTFAAGQSWVDLATYEGPDGTENLYGVFFGTDVKSLVWYVPEQFEEAGYEIPQSMEELKALTEEIAAEGGTPWCIGLGSGAATGWPATDWVEDLMLRTQPPEVYDAWVLNEVPFDDPAVVAAIEEYGWFARNDAFVDGGSASVATRDFRDSPLGLFDLPPKCYMHRQASFIPGFFPEGIELGTDVDFFYFPAYADRDLGKPVLGSGGLISIADDAPVARAFLAFLQTPFAHEIHMSQGQFMTPHTGASPEAYQNPTQRALGEILTNATTFRFDASDLMPGEIGTAAFWTGMVDYQTGASAEDAAASVQNRWDAIR